VLRLGLDMKLFETLAEDNGAPKTVAQLAAPCRGDPLLVGEFLSSGQGNPLNGGDKTRSTRAAN
jgi:hypothetical protein